MKKVRRALLFSVGLVLMAMLGLCGAGAAAPADTATAALEAPPTDTAAIAAAGQSSDCGCKDELSCSCACSPLAGSWIASLTPKEDGKKDGKDGKGSDNADSVAKKARPTLKTFKFIPVNDKCDKFALNAQAVTRPKRVIDAFKEVTDLTEFVGIACKADSKEVNFTAIGYGVERGKEEDKTIFIAVLSGTVKLSDEWSKDGKDSYQCKCCKDSCKDPKCTCKAGYNDKDHSSKCTCCKNGCKYSDCECKTGQYGKNYGKDQNPSKCNEPEKLGAELTVAYFDAQTQDEDGDGFPDKKAEPIVCLPFKAELKRVVLLPQCEPTKTPKVTATGEVQE
jgi:hypothetical protein